MVVRGFLGCGPSLGLWGWGFQLLEPVVWGLLGCWGWGSLNKHNPGKKWCVLALFLQHAQG
mgnify:CR=1 FL=1